MQPVAPRRPRRRRWRAPPAAAAVPLFVAAACWSPARGGPLIESQTPSIAPPGGEFVGEVPEGIAILSNSPREKTRLFYTVNPCNPAAVPGCRGWHRPDPAAAGVGQETRELTYGERIGLTKPGLWFVSAVALTEGFAESFVENGTFRIRSPDLLPPKILTEEGKYRKKVTVKMQATVEGAEVRYTVDGSQPTPDSPKYDGPVDIETAGRHYVKALQVKAGLTSPTVQAVYVVSLPVAYIVTTECSECAGPTSGEPFTLMFQGFRSSPQTKVFVTTARDACTIASQGGGVVHTLQGCGCADTPSNPKGGVVPVDLTWHIHTIDAGHPEVFVCFSADGGNTWDLIPQATPTGADEKYHFTLHPAKEGAQKAPPRPEQAVEAFDAPFDWASHHAQQRSSLQEQLRARTPRTVTMRNQIKEASQSKPLVLIGGVLLVLLGAGLAFSSRRPRAGSGHHQHASSP
eukprot:TRINITY_DN8774_c0_g1_i1.p1 TRINITY_DN8774_c0_g1~~TRINITY_DN8774_c0_g1_i1.p1  ORF type:complete len:460 (+),score=103.43 TRINITY_DN8774_c0_g1_i1:81-1460(+)